MFILCYYLCRLFLFDTAKVGCFSADSKNNLRIFSNLYGQTPHRWTNRGNRPKSCPKGGEIDWTKTEVSREEAYSINLVNEFHGGCDMKEQED